MGRPPKARNGGPIEPEVLEKAHISVPVTVREIPKFVEDCSKIGLSIPQMASLLRKPKEEIEEKFAKEIERGRALGALEIGSIAYEAAKLDKVSNMFWLKCQHKWQETPKNESASTGPITVHLNIIPKVKVDEIT